jgi:hypothetical protein
MAHFDGENPVLSEIFLGGRPLENVALKKIGIF